MRVIPNIVGRLHDHETSKQRRIIVTKCSSSIYYIEKTFLYLIITIVPNSDHVINSASDFIERLNNIRVPGNYLIKSIFKLLEPRWIPPCGIIYWLLAEFILWHLETDIYDKFYDIRLLKTWTISPVYGSIKIP